MESFRQGYRLKDGELQTVFHTQGLTYPPGLTYLYSPYWVRYEIAYYHPDESRYLRIGPLNRIPVNVRTGIYRANIIIGDHWTPGKYRIKWKYRISDASDIEDHSEEFSVLSRGVDSAIFEILYCRRNLGGRVDVLEAYKDLPGSFTILPPCLDIPASFTIV